MITKSEELMLALILIIEDASHINALSVGKEFDVSMQKIRRQLNVLSERTLNATGHRPSIKVYQNRFKGSIGIDIVFEHLFDHESLLEFLRDVRAIELPPDIVPYGLEALYLVVDSWRKAKKDDYVLDEQIWAGSTRQMQERFDAFGEAVDSYIGALEAHKR